MLSNKYHCFIVVLALFSCQVIIPVQCRRQNDHEGLAVLLAAGLLAKILRHKHEEHHIHIPVPVHHHEEHHGSGSARAPVQQTAALPAQRTAALPMQHFTSLPMQHVYGGAMVGMPSHAIIRRIIYAAPLPHTQYAAQSPQAVPY